MKTAYRLYESSLTSFYLVLLKLIIHTYNVSAYAISYLS